MFKQKNTVKKSTLYICLWVFVMPFFNMCNKETQSVNPGQNPKSIYKFNIAPPIGVPGANEFFTIKGYSLLVSDTVSEYPSFLLRGTDTLKNADITLSAKYSSYSTVNLNVNIAYKTQTKFYNNCNSQTASVERGINSKGKYIKITFRPSMYITQKLVSERNMNPECVTSNFDPIIYYY